MWGKKIITTNLVIIMILSGLAIVSIGINPTIETSDGGEKTPIPMAGSSPRTVLVEVFTADTCTYCPSQAHTLDRLESEYGTDNIIVIEHHMNNDEFQLPYCFSRRGSYGVSEMPHLIFDGGGPYNDGQLRVRGGTRQKYGIWATDKADIDERLAVGAPLVMTMEGYLTDVDGQLNVTLDFTDTPTENNLEIRVAVMESGLFHYDENTNEIAGHHRTYNNIVRVWPDPIPIPPGVGPGTHLEYTFPFTLDPSWYPSTEPGRISAASFVQTNNSYEYQDGAVTRRNYPVMQSVYYDFTPNDNVLVVNADSTDFIDDGVDHIVEELFKVNIKHHEWDTLEPTDSNTLNAKTMPAATDMDHYWAVVWYCGNVTNTLTATDRTNIETYLNAGGSVFLVGSNITQDARANGWESWLETYFKVGWASSDTGGTSINGVPGEYIGDGLSGLNIDNTTSPDGIIPKGNGVVSFTYNTGGNAAVRGTHTGGSRTYFSACNYFNSTDTIDTDPTDETVMTRIFNWLNTDYFPDVTLLTPDPRGPDQIYNGVIPIDWIATDAEDDDSTLDIAIDYSPDVGATWLPIMSDVDNNIPPYSWDTVAEGIPDGVNYKIRLTATDSDPLTTVQECFEMFSIDNTPDDRWYLQVESANLGSHLDLDMKPTEREGGADLVQDITFPGEYSIQSFASQYVATEVIDLAGDWDFSTYAKVSDCQPRAEGNLYANIYGDDGVTPRLIATTDYDDELISPYLAYHEFNWVYSVPPGTVINPGEHVVVEIMLHSTVDRSASSYYRYADSEWTWKGTVTEDYTKTFASDNMHETIEEITETELTLFFEDFEGDGSPTFAELGWTLGGASNDWEIGTPIGLGGSFGNPDPIGAHNGSFSIGNDLTGLGARPGDYENNTLEDSNYIYSPAIDCQGSNGVKLNFWRYLCVERPECDQAHIEVSDNAVTWTQVWTNPSIIDRIDSRDDEWINVLYDISAVADGKSTVYVRFEMGATDEAWEYCGWNIDDVRVIGFKPGSNLEHKWTIDIPAGEAPYVFSLEASRPNSPDGDNFMFAYSTDDVLYTDMILVNSPIESVQTYSLPAGLSGTVYIRVVDTERTLGNTQISSIIVDEMNITSTAPAQFTLGFDYINLASYVEPVLNPDTMTTFDITIPNPNGPWPAWRYLSFPIEASGSTTTVLDDFVWGDGGTAWDSIQWYDPLDPANPWKTYSTDKPPVLNNLLNIDNTMGFWIHITDNNLLSDQVLSCGVGDLPASPTDVQLYTGWNMVSYPSTTPRQADLTLPAPVSKMAIYNALQPYSMEDISDLSTVMMSEGKAYWVYADSDVIWTVDT